MSNSLSHLSCQFCIEQFQNTYFNMNTEKSFTLAMVFFQVQWSTAALELRVECRELQLFLRGTAEWMCAGV